jgi:hypothetical protein
MELTINITDKKVYDALARFLRALNIEIVSEKKNSDIQVDEEFYNLSATNLARAYSKDEPEYTLSMLKEQNPDYETK